MKTCKAIQLVAAGALALGLNGLAMAHSIDLNSKSASVRGSVATIATGSAFAPARTGGTANPSMKDRARDATHHGVIRAGYHDHGPTVHPCWGPCVPEPSAYLMMLAGVGIVGFMSYRRQRQSISAGPMLSHV